MKNRFILLFVLFIFIVSGLNAQDVNSNAVKDVDFVADYFPSDSKGKYGVIVLTGSAGGKANDIAKRVSQMGYSVLSLAYFRDGKLPEALEMIPLEYFEAPKKWLMNRKETRNDGVIVLGLSKGAELALVLGTDDAQYKGVIGVAPTSVVWAGIPKDTSTITSASSSWSKNGKPIAFVPYIPRARLRKAGLNKMADWHTGSLGSAKNLEDALIKVEKIKSPILLLSGGKDFVWAANEMSSEICKRVKAAKQSVSCTHINYENKGHMIGLDSDEDGYKEIAKFLNLLNK